MAWGSLASNQMVSFTDAQGGGFTLQSGQSPVTSNQCMTKSDATTKYVLDTSYLTSYASNQLIPKSVWVAPTTTTTTTAAGRTVYWEGYAACAGETVSFIINGVTVCSGTSCYGVTYNVPVGASIIARDTNGPKASGFCTNVLACVSSGGSGNCNLVIDSRTGIGITAEAFYTITSGSPSVLYLNAGLVA